MDTAWYFCPVLVRGQSVLAEDLRDYDLSSYYSDDMEREVKAGEIMTAYGHIAEGYEYPLLKFTVIAESDIFGNVKKKEETKNI